MPAITKDSKVLLTGGSGLIGAAILRTLLEQGFTVRAAVRDQAKADYIKKTFSSHQGKLEFVIIENISAPGAYDEAVKGVDGIIHTAAPLEHLGAPIEPQELIDIAAKGATRIMESAKLSPSVKRVVLTSSVAAIWETKPPPAYYTENNWNDSALKQLEAQGKNSAIYTQYFVSKYAAEKAAWKFMDEAKPSFDFVAILPTFCWGQNLSQRPAETQGSIARFLGPLKEAHGTAEPEKAQLLNEWQMVDVADTAKDHVQALLVPEAGGERFISTSGTTTLQHILNYFAANPIEGVTFPKGDPAVLNDWKPSITFENEKAKKILNSEYKFPEETGRDTVIHALKNGWSF